MKKHVSFLAGVLCALMVVSLGTTALAAEGLLSYNKVGVTLFGETEVKAGETYTAANGQNVPSSITYTDAAGGLTNYLSIRQIAELLDADIDWNSATGSVEIAPPSQGGGVSVEVDGDVIHQSGSGSSSKPDSVAAPFQLVETKIPGTSTKVHTLLSEATFQSSSDFDQVFQYRDGWGQYINITVANNNTKGNAIVNLYRYKTIGTHDRFPSIEVAPGETVTTTVLVDESAVTDLTGRLGMNITYSDEGSQVNVTVKAVQFAA